MYERKRQTIMLVDDNPANLSIGKNMLKDSYEVYALPSAERLFRFLEEIKPDLILLDIVMPIMSGFDVMRILKADAEYADIPVIFLTAKIEEVNELKGLALGAVDYVTKPFSSATLLKRIENHLLIKRQEKELKKFNANFIRMIKEKTSQISELQSSVINIITEMIEFRDVFTGDHIGRTQKYVDLLISHMIEENIYSEEIQTWEKIELIVPSTQLHDIGKIFISGDILNKSGKLTDKETEVMKTHTERGVRIIESMEKKGENRLFFQYAKTIAGSHHEKWNGKGYPLGLEGQEIPLLGRLMAIADVYDALTSSRPYKDPITAEASERIIFAGAGTHFDPVLVNVFEKAAAEFASVIKNSG